METIIGVRFKTAGKIYHFSPGQLTIARGQHVIVETARGMECGRVVTGPEEVELAPDAQPLKVIQRIANEHDMQRVEDNRKHEKEARVICKKKIREHKLPMKLVDVEYTFDLNKIIFYFTADGRIDFRDLVKDLASVFRTRIELRQIGVRDKAKMVGGLGVCGRPFCCREFLDDFQPVSIKMAKTQNLSLNPTKISGVCGRLMCCLKYEQDAYEDLLRTAPKNESFVDTPDGRGTITDVNLLRQSVKVRMEDHPETIGTYKNCDICVLRSGKARKNDPPIPKDLAPISSRPRPAVKPVEEFEPLPEVIYPDDVAFAEPVPPLQAESADPAPVTDEEKASSKNHRRRRGRGGRGNGKPAAEAQAEGAAKAPQEPRPVQDRPKQQNPNRPKQERKPQKPQELREPKEPREPREPRPAPQDQSEKPVGEGGNPNRRRRRYHGKRGGGAPKAEG